MPEENNKQETPQEDQQEKQTDPQFVEGSPEKESKGVNAIALLSYFWLLFLVPLLTAKDDDFAQFHAKQGMILFLLWLCGIFIAIIPVLGWIIGFLINITVIVFAIIGLINVIKGKKEKLPIIGQYSDQLKI